MEIDALKSQHEDVTYLITFLSNQISFAKRERSRMSTASGNFQSSAIVKDLESRLKELKRQQRTLEEQLHAYQSFASNHSYRLMHFIGPAAGLSPTAEVEVAKRIRAFETFPYRYNVAFQENTSAILFVDQKVPQTLAQELFDILCKESSSTFNHVVHNEGSLLLWNGHSFVLVA
ncbi:hypothetical protein CN918_26215 [Priestia megaterium]|nr:hypothetical protein CN918_26215 [Priestia megaterium]